MYKPMRIVYGLDVHKDSVFVCILSENGDKIEAGYGVLMPELEALRRLPQAHGETRRKGNAACFPDRRAHGNRHRPDTLIPVGNRIG